MAKKSVVQRNLKRIRLVKLFAEKRAKIKAVIRDRNTTLTERYAMCVKLSKLCRDSSASRVRLRCFLSHRPRGVFRKFGLCRNKIRELANLGLLPGVVKGSW